MTILRLFLREPLAHFVLLGGLLFAAWSFLNPDDSLDADSRVITVDREQLLTFLQYRNAAFEPGYFEAQFDAMSDEQRALLAQNFVREEAMAREAMALGLDENDYVIRRRLIQKIEYLVTDVDLDPEPPSEEALRNYYDENLDDFRQDAEFTFTHVFIDAERDHPGGLAAEAQRVLASLRRADAGFNDAGLSGDRFPYQRNYVRQFLRPVANDFGPEFASSLAQLQPGETWQGPIASSFGLHLVMLTDRTAARVPDFAEVREVVREAVLERRRTDTREALLDELVEQYDVRYEGVPSPAIIDNGES